VRTSVSRAREDCDLQTTACQERLAQPKAAIIGTCGRSIFSTAMSSSLGRVRSGSRAARSIQLKTSGVGWRGAELLAQSSPHDIESQLNGIFRAVVATTVLSSTGRALGRVLFFQNQRFLCARTSNDRERFPRLGIVVTTGRHPPPPRVAGPAEAQPAVMPVAPRSFYGRAATARFI
jgi:hypothetical protein